jgi:hypothetical protein
VIFNLTHCRIDDPILPADTARMPDMPAASKPAEWRNIQCANLVRSIASGIYFARIRIHGKLIRKSLKTDVVTVAKLRMAGLEKAEGGCRRIYTVNLR